MHLQPHDPPLQVGFIGLGDQGGPMAQAIADRSFPLHVWARRRLRRGGAPRARDGRAA